MTGVLAADEFHEAVESQSGVDVAAAMSVETTSPAVDVLDSGSVTADDAELSSPVDIVTADSDDVSNVNAACDIHAVVTTDNVATDVGNEIVHGDDETISDECPQHVNSDSESGPKSDLPADSTQCVLGEATPGVECTVSCPPQPSNDDATQSQQLDSAVGAVTESDCVEVGDGNLPELNDTLPADDAGDHEQYDEAAFNNDQEIGTTLLHVAEEPSTADSNDDPADFVEAPTSLTPDSTVDTSGSVDQQLEDDEDKDEEQFLDSSSDICALPPDEGTIRC